MGFEMFQKFSNLFSYSQTRFCSCEKKAGKLFKIHRLILERIGVFGSIAKTAERTSGHGSYLTTRAVDAFLQPSQRIKVDAFGSKLKFLIGYF